MNGIIQILPLAAVDDPSLGISRAQKNQRLIEKYVSLSKSDGSPQHDYGHWLPIKKIITRNQMVLIEFGTDTSHGEVKFVPKEDFLGSYSFKATPKSKTESGSIEHVHDYKNERSDSSSRIR